MIHDRRRRVFHLIKSLGRGGAEVLLAEGLAVADRGRFVYAYGYFLPWKDALVGDLESHGADVTCFGGSSAVEILGSARRVARHLRTHGVDLVHAHLPLAGVVARLAGRIARVPVVYTEHNLQERYHGLTRWANRLTWGLQDRAIAVSSEVADSILARIGDRIPVRVVPNGVDVAAFRPDDRRGAEVRASLGIPADAGVLGTVAVFRRQKGLEEWLRVGRRVVDEVPGTRLLLVGDGPRRDRLERQIEVLDLAESVHLPGFRREVRPYLAAMDAYLMTSRFEGFPVALLEAMAMEVPPVALAVGGIPEIVRDGETGVLRSVEDVESLAEEAIALLRDRDRRHRLGAAARRSVVERFAVERMQRELEEIYGEVLAGADP